VLRGDRVIYRAVSNIEPLTQGQRDELLLTKLKYEHARQALAFRLEVTFNDVSETENADAHDAAAQGLGK